MESLPTPVLDNHLHLHPEGKGVVAAEEFARAGGTHLLVLNRPSWHLVDRVEDRSSFRETFDRTLELVGAADEAIPGRAWAVLGVHPALLPRLVDDRGWAVDRATETMAAGLELAAAYVEAGDAVAIKSGRPHYDVSEALWRASNELIRHAFELADEVGCAVQLHTEETGDLTEVADWAEAAGLGADRVVKHFATGPIDGVVPSAIARTGAVESIVDVADRFLLETDFLDDPTRPGAVLGPKLVPRRSRELAEAGRLDALEIAHVETPAAVYGIDTLATRTG